MTSLRNAFSELGHYPSAIIGLLIIASLFAVALYAVTAIPYNEAVYLWRGGEGVWSGNPRNAGPAWLNLLPGRNLPVTIAMDSVETPASKAREEVTPEMTDVIISFPFEYTYDGFPQDIAVFLSAEFDEKRPHVSMTWHTPDGREIRLGEVTVQGTETYNVTQDERLARRMRGQDVMEGLFGAPAEESAAEPQDGAQIIHGTYELRVAGLVFEEEADMDARMVLYGQLHGTAGTDHRRRDLMVALLWGTPTALAFGFLAAVGSTVSTMIIAAIGVWFGRWIDAAIQRITEVNLILPVLPILIMVGTLYSRSIWTMLGMVILLGIFSAGIKTYRAIFLQVKESPYIEAARAYGAGHFRIIFSYMIPRIIPVLVPQFVVLIPSFVFLEATLAVLGLGDPVLPTWGKVLNDARANGALYQGHYYWMLEPAVLLMVTGLGFAMVGFALDRVFNPRLRDL